MRLIPTEVILTYSCYYHIKLPSISSSGFNTDLNAQTLTAIEATFQQFHALLDLLNEKGSLVPQMC